jgi:DNA-binding IclR family transcriptional regulator
MAAESSVVGRAAAVLRIVGEEGGASLGRICERSGLSSSTAHRIVMSLAAQGLIVPAARGSYMIGPALLRLAGSTSPRDLLVAMARPRLRRLARACRAHAHLGVFETDMVTYLVRIAFGRRKLFSVEGMQLEAYCSALGKVLLAGLPERERESYLAAGPFVPLTANTITDAAALRQELAGVWERGFALDNEEILPGLQCLAVPVRDAGGRVHAAISISAPARAPSFGALAGRVGCLRQVADELAAALC